MAKCSKSCACYYCRGDHTWELLDAMDAAKRAGYTPGSGQLSDAAKKAYFDTWRAGAKAHKATKKGR